MIEKLQYSISLNNDAAWNMEKYHMHDGYELMLVINGGDTVFIRDRRLNLTRGTLILLGISELHKTTGGQSAEYSRYVVHIPRRTIETLSSANTNLVAAFDSGPRFAQLNERSLGEAAAKLELAMASSDGFGDDIRRDISFVNFLLFICREFDIHPAAPINEPESFRRMLCVTDYIRSHLCEPLSLELLSHEFLISRHYLCHAFKRCTGFTVTDYIINCRILNAQTLLQQGRSVQEAGEASGFGDNSHFIRTFHARTGVTPGVYARRFE